MHLWPEMSQEMGNASLLTLYYILHLSLKAAVLGASHPEAGESGMAIGSRIRNNESAMQKVPAPLLRKLHGKH